MKKAINLYAKAKMKTDFQSVTFIPIIHVL